MTGSVEFDKTNQNIKMDTVHYMETQPDLSWKSLNGTSPADMLTVILQQGINGIVVGSLYVLVALGLTLIYGVLVQINFAHADIVTLGAFAAYFFTHCSAVIISPALPSRWWWAERWAG